MRAYLITTVFAVGLVGLLQAAPIEVGASVPTGGATELDASEAPMHLVTADGWIVFDFVGIGLSNVSAVSDGECTVYLYATDSSGDVTRRYGPMYLRDWMPGVSLVPQGARIHAIQVEDVVGETMIVVRGG